MKIENICDRKENKSWESKKEKKRNHKKVKEKGQQ